MPKGKKEKADPTQASSDSEAILTLADIAKNLKALTETITSVKNTLDQQIAKQDIEAKTNETNHEELKKELKDIKEELTAVTRRADESDTVNKLQAEQIERLEMKISELEDEKRSHNIIIEGIKEKNNEDFRGIIDDLLNDLGLNFTVEWCDSIYENLKDLPHGLSIEAAKMVKVHDGLAFQSKHAPFSNLHPCQIRHDDKQYSSVEQGLQFEHATTCKDEEIAAQIMKTNDPERIMALARRLPESKEWKNKEVEVCKKYNTKKYEQNPTLKRRLLQSRGHLYEATRNKTFGC